MGVLTWEGRLRSSSELGPQGSGGSEWGKKGEETIWFSSRWVKCGAGGREREGAAREGELLRMGEHGVEMAGGKGDNGGQGLGGRRKLGKKRETQRARGERQGKWKEETRRLGNRNGGGKNCGEVVTGRRKL